MTGGKMETMLALNAQDTHVTHKITQQTVLSVHLASAGAKLTAVGRAINAVKAEWGLVRLLGCPGIRIFSSPALLATHPRVPT